MTLPSWARAREKLFVALDLPRVDDALRTATALRGLVGGVKVGSELFTAAGPAIVRELVEKGCQVFLDLKFHDIPNTVRAAAREAAHLGVAILDVHAAGGRKMMEAAVEGARQGSAGQPVPLVLAVTVLTSLNAADLQEIGIDGLPESAVVRLARLAKEAGLDGVVASAREIAAIRAACGDQFVIAVPGIRPSRHDPGDQSRTATPGEAIRNGASLLVVGRPITGAADPRAAALAIIEEMELAGRASQP
jgi:orotidine-5'-phosphate decarboxylase